MWGGGNKSKKDQQKNLETQKQFLLSELYFLIILLFGVGIWLEVSNSLGNMTNK